LQIAAHVAARDIYTIEIGNRRVLTSDHARGGSHSAKFRPPAEKKRRRARIAAGRSRETMSRVLSGVLTGSEAHANVRASFLEQERVWGRRTSRGCGMDATRHDFPDELARHRPSLERSARRLCRNAHDAEDLVQTTLEKAWRAREQFLPGGNIGGWLYRILTNRHRDNLRRRAGVQVPLPDELPDRPQEAEEISSLLALPPETVLEALGQLPPELREPLELMAVHGKRYREIADALAMPINTVGTRIRRARLLLQASFSKAAAERAAQGGKR
jgi:RNA polymerase sigma-70 factor (ECF subfamily)